MKIVILNGSPRSLGLISQMLKFMMEEAQACGAEVEMVTINRLLMRPCIGCMNCRSKHVCVLPQDDAHKTMQKIQEADAIIVGTPCYWGNMNGYLKVLFDRIVYGLVREEEGMIPQPLQKGKKAIILATSTTPWPWNILFNQSNGALKAVRKILTWSGYNIIGSVQKGGTRKKPYWTDRERKKCLSLIHQLVK